MIQAPLLQKGDTIALISPAKAIDTELVLAAKAKWEEFGYKVIIGKHACDSFSYFSAPDYERGKELEWAIDHPEVKAIICCRGGYGAVRLLESVNWANLLREPKWIIGFSDITNFHLLGLKLGIETIHATMPLNYAENSSESFESLLSILEKGFVKHNWKTSKYNKNGEASGKLVGGNMSIVYSLLGTPYCPNFENSILFFEDLSEQVYHIDRMIQAFKLAGVFEQISGLIIGGMTEMKDTAIPTNYSIPDLFKEAFNYRNIPICFDVPIGHINDNRAVIQGRESTLIVSSEKVEFIQL